MKPFDSLHPQKTLRVLVLLASGALAAFACSTNDNDAPSDDPPVIHVGGSGGSGARDDGGDANSDAVAGAGASPASSGSSGESGAAGESAAAGEGGAAGAAGALLIDDCPTSDLGFYNQNSASQKSVFDNGKRLGTHPSLPKLPGS